MNKQQNTTDQNTTDQNTTDQDKKYKPEASLDRQKAEALLDNLKEDRASILKYIPKEQKRARSGKNW